MFKKLLKKIKFKKFLLWILSLVITGVSAASITSNTEKEILNPEIANKKQQEQQISRKYKPADHNLDRVKFESLRKKIDYKYRDAHDALSEAFYEGKEFVWKDKNYGVLDKQKFEKMQAKIWAEYQLLFDNENQKMPAEDRIPDEDYKKKIKGGQEINLVDEARQKVNELKSQGIDINL